MSAPLDIEFAQVENYDPAQTSSKGAKQRHNNNKKKKGGKSGCQGNFHGQRLRYMDTQLPAFLPLKGTARAIQATFWENCFSGYWKKFGWWIPLDEEPDETTRVAPDESLPEVLAEKNAIIKLTQARIRAHLRYRRQVNLKAGTNPFAHYLAALTEQAKPATPPRQLAPWQLYMSKKSDVISEMYNARWPTAGLADEHKLAFRCTIARELFDKETAEYKTQVQEEVEQIRLSDEEHAKEHEAMLHAPVDPDVQALARDNLVSVVQPLMEGLRTQTGLYLALLAGIPCTTGPREFQLKVITAGKTNDDVPVPWHLAESEAFKHDVMGSWTRYLMRTPEYKMRQALLAAPATIGAGKASASSQKKKASKKKASKKSSKKDKRKSARAVHSDSEYSESGSSDSSSDEESDDDEEPEDNDDLWGGVPYHADVPDVESLDMGPHIEEYLWTLNGEEQRKRLYWWGKADSASRKLILNSLYTNDAAMIKIVKAAKKKSSVAKAASTATTHTTGKKTSSATGKKTASATSTATATPSLASTLPTTTSSTAATLSSAPTTTVLNTTTSTGAAISSTPDDLSSATSAATSTPSGSGARASTSPIVATSSLIRSTTALTTAPPTSATASSTTAAPPITTATPEPSNAGATPSSVRNATTPPLAVLTGTLSEPMMTTAHDAPRSSRETMAALPASIVVDDDGWPEWLRDGFAVMEAESDSIAFMRALEWWTVLERAYGWDAKSGRGFATTHRPLQVAHWMKVLRREYTKVPDIEDEATYASNWWKWWGGLQPEWREHDTEGRPIAGGEGDWDALEKPGKNGFLIVLISLWWWKGVASSATMGDWSAAVEDVAWVVSSMAAVKTGRDGTSKKRNATDNASAESATKRPRRG